MWYRISFLVTGPIEEIHFYSSKSRNCLVYLVPKRFVISWRKIYGQLENVESSCFYLGPERFYLPYDKVGNDIYVEIINPSEQHML